MTLWKRELHFKRRLSLFSLNPFNSSAVFSAHLAKLNFLKYRKLGAKVDIRQRKLLEQGVREEEVEVGARLQSLTLPHAGDWLHAAPSWP